MDYPDRDFITLQLDVERRRRQHIDAYVVHVAKNTTCKFFVQEV